MRKFEVMPMINLYRLGISPGKSPFGGTHAFPTAIRPGGVGQLAQSIDVAMPLEGRAPANFQPLPSAPGAPKWSPIQILSGTNAA